MEVRKAEEGDIAALAQLWHDSWRDAHAAIAPPELTRIRTRASFTLRMTGMLPTVRVIGPVGSPLGFYANQDDELSQLFVAAEARGKGIAALLIAAAEAELAANGFETAWLACAIGNHRAARFYEKSGWLLARNFISQIPSPDGIIPLEVWRYEKSLR